VREGAKVAFASLITFAVLMSLWSGLIRVLELPPQVLPGPLEVLSTWWHGWTSGAFWPHARFTLQGALGGWLIGAALGVVGGVIVGEWTLMRRVFYPIVIAIQSMPTVAVAPLIVVYFGVDLPSKLVTVALLCFFPVFVNTVAGLGTAEPRLLDLYRAALATRWRTLVDVRLPAAADSILAGLQVALVLSFIGCVVSEFVASRAGLGYLVKTFATDLNVAVMFAAVLSLAIIGSTLGFGLGLLRRRLVFWREER
jgi:NitT/TauT family transport system permease protein